MYRVVMRVNALSGDEELIPLEKLRIWGIIFTSISIRVLYFENAWLQIWWHTTLESSLTQAVVDVLKACLVGP